MLFLNCVPILNIAVFYFTINFECSLRNLEEKMGIFFFVLLETHTSSTPVVIILDWITEREIEFRNLLVLWVIYFLKDLFV